MHRDCAHFLLRVPIVAVALRHRAAWQLHQWNSQKSLNKTYLVTANNGIIFGRSLAGYAEKHCNASGAWSLDGRGRGERTDYTKCHRVDAILTQVAIATYCKQ